MPENAMPVPPTQSSPDYRPVSDYAAIGDASVLALVSSSGSMDWLCLPYFSSPSVFGALLDAKRGGHFRVGPVGPDGDMRVSRRYLEDSNILETTFKTATGVLRVTDLMCIGSREQKRSALHPEHEILRQIECIEGEVEVEVHFAPRPHYGQRPRALKDRGRLGIFGEIGAAVLALQSEVALGLDAARACARGCETLSAGARRFVSLSYTRNEPCALLMLGDAAARRVERTLNWWREWAGRCEYDGPWRDAVMRSALTLKLLSYPPSGAVIAAATTSLPEHPGGDFNWDYRYCWLRDSSMVVRTLLELGYDAESDAFLGWLLDTTRLTRPRMQVVYDIFGEADLREQDIDGLEGYQGARPVRRGNGAFDQLQIGIYGELVEAVFHHVQHRNAIQKSDAKMLLGVGQVVCEDWPLADAGIWETREKNSDHTHSKFMCWLTLDRLIRLHEQGYIAAPVAQYKQARAAIAEAIETHGFNAELGSYSGVFGGEHLDAALFLMAIYGYNGGPWERVVATCERLREHLGDAAEITHAPHLPPSLIYRFRPGYDGFRGDGAPFGICCFWNVSALAISGEVDRAEAVFERLLGDANDVGLYSEQIDRNGERAPGNFPQAFTHVGLINAALTIAQKRGHIHTRTQPPGVPSTYDGELPPADHADSAPAPRHP